MTPDKPEVPFLDFPEANVSISSCSSEIADRDYEELGGESDLTSKRTQLVFTDDKLIANNCIGPQPILVPIGRAELRLYKYREPKMATLSRCLELQKKPTFMLHRVNSKTGSIMNLLDVSLQESQIEIITVRDDSSPIKSRYMLEYSDVTEEDIRAGQPSGLSVSHSSYEIIRSSSGDQTPQLYDQNQVRTGSSGPMQKFREELG